MSGFTYNKDLVDESIRELNLAKTNISNLEADITSALATIKNARGSNYIELKESEMNNFIEDSKKELNYIISNINSQVKAIEAYQKYQDDIASASIFKRVGATVTMAALNLIEGVVGEVENILDGFGSLVGIFVPKVRKIVEKDYVGDFFEGQYTSGYLSSINKYSYMSYDGVAATVFKGIGAAIPFVLVAYFTAGTSAALEALPAVTSVLSGMGSKVESELQSGNESYTNVMGKGLLSGGIEGLITTLIGKSSDLFKTSSSASAKLASSASKAAKNSAKVVTKPNILHKLSNKILKSPAGIVATGLIKNSKIVKTVSKVSSGLKNVGSKILKSPVGIITTGLIKDSKVVKTVSKVSSNFKKAGSKAGSTVKKVVTTLSTNGQVAGGTAVGFGGLTLTAKKTYDKSNSKGTTVSTDTADDSSDISIESPEEKTVNTNANVNTNTNSSSQQYYNDNPKYRKTQPPTTQPPTTTQPVTTQPVTTQPVTTQPVTTQPVTTQPVTTQPVTTQPVTTQPVTTQPVTTQPVTTQPVTTQPVTTQPPTTRPATQPQPVTTIINNNYYSTSAPSQGTSSNGTTTPDIIEILDDGLDDSIDNNSTASDITNDTYDEPYIVEPPVDTTATTKSKSVAGPILTGVGLAGAAGVGAKVYLDKKKQQESGEYDETTEDYEEDDSSPIKADDWEEENESFEYEENNGLDYEYPID